MEAGRPLPGRHPPARTEVVHECDRTRVTRLFLPERTVVRKEPLGPDAQRRLWHELTVLERLRGVAGVAQLVEAPREPGSVTLVDAGGRTFAELPKPVPVDVLVGLALELARAVAGMHRRGVLHRDISPANVVVSRDGTPCLVDFAAAASIGETRPEHARAQIVGTLAYVAPEQTGRTGRSVDQRADLYALGATLYELATGATPFRSDDPLRLIHDHLVRIPTPPAQVNAAVPGPLSEIVVRLLEKEPDKRYQTAESLVHDLERLRAARTEPAADPIRPGAGDLPLRILPPSRLVGRDAELAALQDAFEDALTSRCRAVLVSGPAGVGKTALVDRLRPVVARRGGRFLAGKFDQYRRDLEQDGGYQAFRALGRLLLAEPEDELAQVRERILAAVGPNTGLLTAIVPEFAALLAVPADPGDPLTAQFRAQRTSVQTLRAVASRERPVVLFLDDLHWAGRTPLGFVDAFLDDEPIDGLLLVGAYRTDDDGARPPPDPLSRARDRTGVRHLALGNLPVPSLVTLVAEMLHVDATAAAELVEVIEPHTSGNPYETAELLDALRHDGVLTATAAGWRWDTAAVRARLGRSEAAGLPATRVEAMPPDAREMVEAMACLGGRAEMSLLQTATGEPAGVVEQRVAPALDEGILVVESGAQPAVRFRHDRIREAILRGLAPRGRRTLQLAMARRLGAVPALSAVAAEQYLPVADAVDDPAERRHVVELLRRAADQAGLVGNYGLVNALLDAALTLLDPDEIATLIAVHTGRHTALFSLGRLEEADDAYRTIDGLSATALDRAEATRVQVSSLTHRNRFADAVALGVESLRDLGIAVPPPDEVAADTDHQVDHLYRWLDHTDAADTDTEPARPKFTDPTLLAATRLISAVLPPAFFVPDFPLYAWLSLETVRIWLEHGPGRSLLGPATHAANAAMALRGDYAVAYHAMRRVLERGEACGYEPETSVVRSSFATLCCWFEPIELAVQEGERALEGLIAGGELAWAGYVCHTIAADLQDCAPSLDAYLSAVEAHLAFVRRTGNEQSAQLLDPYRWLAGVLRGESAAAARDPIPIDQPADNPTALVYTHVNRAIVAAVLDDARGLARHTAAAMPLLPAAQGIYPTAVAHMLRGLTLAEQARSADGDERAALLAELDEVTGWLAARAADAPANFWHMLRLLEAERAWTVGDFHAAVLAFDTAQREVAARPRPWHRALITERAARFHLAHGIDHAGLALLTRARDHYAAWGTTAKVTQLDWAHHTLHTADPAAVGTGDALPPSSTVTTGTVDLLGILAASQALSSQTSIDRLHTRVVEVLGAMTGATDVHLTPWNDDRQEWQLPAARHGAAATIASTSVPMSLPTSVLRYVRRTGEPLVVPDATRDPRFARDPYFSGLERCSLLALPVFGRGTLRAVLLLENRLIRDAFTTDRLDAVRLIAGQLAVSLDNAQLYTELTSSRARIVTAADQARRCIERDLHDGAQQHLVSLALQLRAAHAAVPPGATDLATLLDDLAAQAATALDELRELARGIHPAVLTEGGLQPALTTLARRSPVPVHLTDRTGRRLPEEIETAAYYLAAEALTNIAKHARATTATIDVDIHDGVVQVRVSDDGRGGADPTTGTGLLGLKDRIEALGGRLTLHTAPGAGTTVHAQLPLNRDDTVPG
jgi:signal transduction histidine kinase